MAKVILPRTNIVRGFNHGRPAEPRPEIAAPTLSVDHHERILLLEDEAQTNFILREYLGSLGYQVVAVANGVDGLKEVMKSDFELVICDMMMPKLPGDMFYLAVQKTRPQLCNRFVFITGHQENPGVDAFIAKTHSAILVKPFRLQQLEATLESILSRFPKKVHSIQDDAPHSDVTPMATPAPAPAPVPENASPSMMSKALKLVGGFMRHGTSAPKPAPAVPEPRRTRRIQESDPKVTRRIPLLANAPVVAPPRERPPVDTSATIRVTRRVPAPTDTPAPAEEAVPSHPKISRRIPIPMKPPAGKTSAKSNATPIKKTATAARTSGKVPAAPAKATPKAPVKAKAPVKTQPPALVKTAVKPPAAKKPTPSKTAAKPGSGKKSR